ncbi:MAG: hypothetical protein WC758_08415 [Candidatus Woesearchaeota archaeon]|jgi:hypothetical protein
MNKKGKTDNTVFFVVIGIVIFILIITQGNKLTLPNLINQNKEVQTGITVTCYDINKVQIDCNPKVESTGFNLNDFFKDIQYKISNLFSNKITGYTQQNGTSSFFGSILKLMGSVGNFAIIPYTSQCTIPACDSGYTAGSASCDDVTHKCSRTCTKITPEGCGTYGSFTQVQNRLMSYSSSYRGTLYGTSSYLTSTSNCYKFYAQTILSPTDWGTADSYNIYSTGSSLTASSQCITNGVGTSTTPTYTLGRGTGASFTATGRVTDYGALTCSGGYPIFELKGGMTISLFASTAPWVIGGTDTKTNICTYTACVESWTCGAWTTCSGNTQTRTCTDANACGTTINKPATSQTCSVACVPTTCASQGITCGTTLDGCGTTLTCGSACVTPPTTGMCYQESANVATACGGKSTGSYTSSNNFGAGSGTGSAVYDGDWGTGASRDTSGTSSLTSIYYKPLNAQGSSLWQIKYGTTTSTTKSLTIPADCWGAFTDRIQLKLESFHGGSYGNSMAYCWNGAWKLIDTSTADNLLYEEAMNWDITSPITSKVYQINVVNAGAVQYDNIQLASVDVGFPGGEMATLYNYFPHNIFSLKSGENTNWTSSLIPVSDYSGKNLYVDVSAYNTYSQLNENFPFSMVIT